jgi:hypothetical protein
MEERLEGRELEQAIAEYKRDIDRTPLRQDLKRSPQDRVLFGRSFRYLELDRLIATKRAAGCRKDLEAIAELEALREESQS